MRTLDLDQYWPAVKGTGTSSGPDNSTDTTRALLASVDELPANLPKLDQDHIVEQPATEPRDRRTPLIWSGLGFAAGMFAWHMIGFWTFVSHVVFDDDARVAATAKGHQQPTMSNARGGNREQNDLGNCIALAIDRTNGDAKPGACPADEKPLADAGRTPRDDLAHSRSRLQDPQLWADATAVESEVAAEKIDESVFDLSIRPGP